MIFRFSGLVVIETTDEDSFSVDHLVFHRELNEKLWLEREAKAQEEFRKKKEDEDRRQKQKEEQEVL